MAIIPTTIVRTCMIASWMLCLLSLNSGKGLAQESPFNPSEKLSYLISWSFIPAARATLETVHPLDNDPPGTAQHFILTAYTLPAIAWIYPYQEQVHSYVTEGLGHSLMYTKQQTSKHPRDIVVRFDWQTGTAQYSNLGRAEDPISIPPETIDPLSALFYIRTQQLAGPFSLQRWVTDGKNLSLGRATFLRQETITLNGKRYQAMKIEPDLRDVKGVFEKSPGAAMHIWLTDDGRKILLKLKSEVTIGSFVAELIEEESIIPGAPIASKPAESTHAPASVQPWENTDTNSNAP